jgi:type VI secretion system protein VasD
MVNAGVTYRAMIGGIVLMLLVGCASAPPEDVILKGSIQASEDVNPGVNGSPSPLVMRIFQLKSRSKFEEADYFALFDDAEATLGADLLAVEQLMLTPGEYRAYEGEFDPETRFVGVIAGYRDINQAQWRSLVEMPEESITKFLQRSALVINAGRLSLSVNAGD